MTSEAADIALGRAAFRLIWMRPLLSVVFRAVDADERRKGFRTAGSLRMTAGQIPLALGHGRERNVLCTLGNAQKLRPCPAPGKNPFGKRKYREEWWPNKSGDG